MSPLRDPAEQEGPATPFERGFFAFFLTVVLALFVAEIINDYHPTKLFALFFILWWIPLLVLHELGHAVVAWWFGARLHLITIGANKVMFRFTVGGVPVEFRMIPLSGVVIFQPRSADGLRWKSALIAFAGPGAELLAVLLLVAIFGLHAFVTYSEEIPCLLVQAFAAAALWGALTNLVPFSFPRGGRLLVSDGLAIWHSFTRPRHELERTLLYPEDEAALEEEENDQWWR